jgi:hypothetical protein
MVSNRDVIIHKTKHKKGVGMIITSIKRVILQLQSRLSVCLTLNTMGLRKTIERLPSLPNKKKKDQELPTEEKKCNKSHSGKRIVMERTHLQDEKA